MLFLNAKATETFLFMLCLAFHNIVVVVVVTVAWLLDVFFFCMCSFIFFGRLLILVFNLCLLC